MVSKTPVLAVTGAASGMGRELSRAYAADGAKIGIIDVQTEALEILQQELSSSGVVCAAATADVRQREQVQAAILSIVEKLGPIDMLICCAGICRASTVDDLKVGELEKVMQINFLGTVYAIEAVLPSMLERRCGQIVGIASMSALRGIPFEPAYSASKAAVTVYLESLRRELRPRGISVSTMFPGFVQTPLLDGINGEMGADMSKGVSYTAVAAAMRMKASIERKHAYAYFPWSLGISVRLSRLLPARVYDEVMERMFRHLPIGSDQSKSPLKRIADQ